MNDKIIEAEESLLFDMQFAVQAAMKKRRLTQGDLAKLVGCTTQNISKILGHEANPSVKTFAKLLVAMDEKFEFRTETLNDI